MWIYHINVTAIQMNNQAPATINPLSKVWGDFASRKVSTIGKVKNKNKNYPVDNSFMATKTPIIVKNMTQAEPSYDLVNFSLLNKAVALYLCFPKILPIGSAKPSPNPLESIGITNRR